jgi:putative CocE/NonD family hydrolase
MIYPGVERHSFYIYMRDDVKLAVTVLLPKGLSSGEKVPALVSQSRYWREMELRPPFAWFISPDVFLRRLRGYKPFFVRRGYAMVMVDERGTGASFGQWLSPWDAKTLDDARQVVDWIVAQPWSNGRMGSYGISYLGTTAEMFAALCHPAVKATIPMFNHPDPYLDIGYPGGIFNQRFIRAWDQMNRELDLNRIPAEFGWGARLLLRGVRPVDRDRRRRLIGQAILGHRDNTNIFSLGEAISCRDERVGDLQLSVADVSLERYHAELAQTQTAVFGWGSWIDAGTADAVLRRFVNYPSCRRAVIGAWEHGGTAHSSPYDLPDRPAKPPLTSQWSEMLRFFDAYLKDGSEQHLSENTLFYYNMGDEAWKCTSVWPPAGTRLQRWHLSSGRQLLPDPPGDDRCGYLWVDFNASTVSVTAGGNWVVLAGRWSAWADGAGSHLLVHLSPLDRDLQIAGHTRLTLYLSSARRWAVFAYLEDVHPDGQVTT